MKPILSKKNKKNDLKIAVQRLLKGDLVILPTETVYGIGADATNNKAVKKIFHIKNRPFNNPIICHFENLEKVKEYVKLNEIALKMAEAFWPGPLTLILKKRENSPISPYVSNNNSMIGCRVPNHPLALKILKSLNRPIAAPSANITTKLSSTNVEHLDDKLKKNVFIINGGSCDVGLESTVVNTNNDKTKILRYGSITEEEIKNIISKIDSDIYENIEPLSPGQQNKHYSPNIPIRINVSEVCDGEVLLNFGSNKLFSNAFELNLSPSANLKEAAKNFFDYLHKLDDNKYKGIAVVPIPHTGLGKTINDRLKRAKATKK